jgi:hypothetical protein
MQRESKTIFKIELKRHGKEKKISNLRVSSLLYYAAPICYLISTFQ